MIRRNRDMVPKEKRGQCNSLTSRGTRCKLPRIEGERVCSVHKRFPYRRRIPPAKGYGLWGGKRKRTNRPPSASKIRADMERLEMSHMTGRVSGGERAFIKKMKELSEALKEATKTERDGGI